MESRAELLDSLFEHEDLVLAALVREERSTLNREIEQQRDHENRRDRDHDERFE
jgi:hypothetical protein